MKAVALQGTAHENHLSVKNLIKQAVGVSNAYIET